MTQASDNNLYELLGVSPDATSAELRAGYLQAAQTCHPDLNSDNANADAQFKLIRRVYEILSDPIQRSVYDNSPGSYRVVGSDVAIDGISLRAQAASRQAIWEEKQRGPKPHDSGFRPNYGAERRRWETVPTYLLGLTTLFCLTLIPIGLGRMFLNKSNTAQPNSTAVESPQPLEASAPLFKEKAIRSIRALREGVHEDSTAATSADASDEHTTAETVSSDNASDVSEPQAPHVPLDDSTFRAELLPNTEIDLPLDPYDANGVAQAIAPNLDPAKLLSSAPGPSAAPLNELQTYTPSTPTRPSKIASQAPAPTAGFAAVVDGVDSSSLSPAPNSTEFVGPRVPTNSLPPNAIPTNVPDVSIPSEAEWQRIGFGPSPLPSLPSYPVRYPASIPLDDAVPNFGAGRPLPNEAAATSAIPTAPTSTWTLSTSQATLSPLNLPQTGLNNSATFRAQSASQRFSAVPSYSPLSRRATKNSLYELRSLSGTAGRSQGPTLGARYSPPTSQFSSPSTGLGNQHGANMPRRATIAPAPNFPSPQIPIPRFPNPSLGN